MTNKPKLQIITNLIKLGIVATLPAYLVLQGYSHIVNQNSEFKNYNRENTTAFLKEYIFPLIGFSQSLEEK